jgi:hypothetical protein
VPTTASSLSELLERAGIVDGAQRDALLRMLRDRLKAGQPTSIGRLLVERGIPAGRILAVASSGERAATVRCDACATVNPVPSPPRREFPCGRCGALLMPLGPVMDGAAASTVLDDEVLPIPKSSLFTPALANPPPSDDTTATFPEREVGTTLRFEGVLSPPEEMGDGVEPNSDTLPFRKVLSLPREQKDTLPLPPDEIMPQLAPQDGRVGIPPRVRPTTDTSFPSPAFASSQKAPNPYSGPQGLPPVIQDARMESSGVKPKPPPELNVDSGAVTVGDFDGSGGAFPSPPLPSTAEVNLMRSTAERKNPYPRPSAARERAGARESERGTRETDRGARTTLVLVIAGFIAMTLAVGLGVGAYFVLKAVLGW